MSLNTTFVAVLSAKGGVGKTTVAVNLACALHHFNRDVIIVDGNYSKPNVGLQLGITSVSKNLHHSLRAEADILDTIYAHPSGVRLIPGSLVHEEVLGKHHRSFSDILLTLRGKSEIVLVDSCPGICQETQDIMYACDKAILVTQPELSSITDVQRTKRLCKERGVDIIGVIVNDIRNEDHEISLSDIENIIGEKVIAAIPHDKNLKFAQKAKYPVVYANPRAISSEAFLKLAGSMIGEEYEPDITKSENIFKYVLQKLGLI